MKTNFKYVFLMAAALVVGFSSCSNDDADNKDAESQTLVIKLPSDVVLGRAVEDPVPGTTKALTVEDITVFLLSGNTVVDIQVFDPIELGIKEKRIEQVQASVNYVMLLANVPTGVTLPTAGASADAIKNFAFTIESQNNSAGIGKKTLLGEGTPATAVDPNASTHTGHNYRSVTIDLNALTARMEIGTVKAGTGIESIKLEGVWINSFYANGAKTLPATLYASDNTCWKTTPLASAGPFFVAQTVTIDSPYVPAAYHNPGNNNVKLYTAPETSQVYAYHVFAGSNVPHLIMLVSGEYATGYYTGTDKFFLGWVTFTKFLDGSVAIPEMLANYIYKIGTDGNGITITPDMLDPLPEYKPFDLGIEVKITEWTEKTVTPSV